MNKMPGRLGSLHARDIMCRELLVISENMPLEEAVTLMKAHKHSGAPVIDSQGRLVGTFSLRDLTGFKEHKGTGTDADSDLITAEAMEHILKSKIEKKTVSERMTTNPPSVTENGSLIDVARLMCRFHTHRIPVTTTTGELTGIITTMDILAAMVHAADELND